MKLGIIGCGDISPLYIRSARVFESLDIVACADLEPMRAEARAAEFGLQALGVEALLADPSIELVINLTVPQAHAAVALLVNAYRTYEGQDPAEQGIRRQRLSWHEPNKVLVIAGEHKASPNHYAIFDLEELLILLGCEPQICWRVDPRRVRREYGLDALARAA
jgi:hypothetical protein